jgi:hypothetical protein
MISKEGSIQQLVWNRAASERGLEGVGVTLRHTPRAHLADTEVQDEGSAKVSKAAMRFRKSGTQKDIQLTWMGTPIFPDRDDLDPETLKLVRVDLPSTRDPVPDQDEEASAKFKNGRYRTAYAEPDPLGGVVAATPQPRGPGRPRKLIPVQKLVKGIKPRALLALVNVENPRIGRSEGSKIKPRLGRPKGSKNKPKIVVDAG